MITDTDRSPAGTALASKGPNSGVQQRDFLLLADMVQMVCNMAALSYCMYEPLGHPPHAPYMSEHEGSACRNKANVHCSQSLQQVSQRQTLAPRLECGTIAMTLLVQHTPVLGQLDADHMLAICMLNQSLQLTLFSYCFASFQG